MVLEPTKSVFKSKPIFNKQHFMDGQSDDRDWLLGKFINKCITQNNV